MSRISNNRAQSLRSQFKRERIKRRHRRISVESLEQRLPLAASVYVDDGVLVARGDEFNQELIIEDAHVAGDTDAIVSFDANGDGDFASDPNDLEEVNFGLIKKFDIRLGDGDDLVGFFLRDDYEDASKKIYADLGDGTDGLSFDAGGAAIDDSKVSLKVRAGAGDDELEFIPADIRGSSRIQASISTGDGADAVSAGLLRPITEGSSLRMHVSLGRGDDEFFTDIDADNFAVLDGSSLTLHVAGQSGNDSLGISPFGGTGGGFAVQGSLSVAMRGGHGDDEITVDLGDISFENAKVSVFVDGGRGSDVLSTSVNATDASTRGKLAIVTLGGCGDDVLTVDASDESDLLRSFILLNGGHGLDECFVTGTLAAHTCSCEL